MITGIKLLYGKCIACGGKASRVFMAFQARICRACCHRLLVSDHELAWSFGIDRAAPPYIVRYVGNVRVRFFMRQHVLPPRHLAKLTREQVYSYMAQWPGIQRAHIRRLIEQMG